MKGMLDTDPDLASKTVYLQNFVRSIEKKKKKKGGYILYFGRYSEEKGIRMLLDVCRELKDIPFAFAGSGPLAELVGRERNLKISGFSEKTNWIRPSEGRDLPSVRQNVMKIARFP